MSLALAVLLFVWIDPLEKLHLWKVLAIVLALSGVVLSSLRNDGTKWHWNVLVWPLMILFGSTAIDFVLAHYATHPQTLSETKLYSCLSFGTAAIVGIVAMVVGWMRTRSVVTAKEFGFGV